MHREPSVGSGRVPLQKLKLTLCPVFVARPRAMQKQGRYFFEQGFHGRWFVCAEESTSHWTKAVRPLNECS